MQSSPPPSYQRDERMGSPAQSHYSLDLDALSDDDDEPSLKLPTAQVDQVRSDEIDGPSDFTINMGAWMRGNKKMSTKTSAPAERKPSLYEMDGEAKNKSDTGTRQDEGQAGTTGQEDSDAHSEDEQVQPSESDPSTVRPYKEEKNDRQAEEAGNDSSVWDPYNTASSPPHMRPTGLLQPTVEDYHSELTPSRPLSRSQRVPRTIPMSPGRPSSPTLSPVRTPIPPRKTENVEDADVELRRLTAELSDMQGRHDEVARDAKSLDSQLMAATKSKDSAMHKLEEVDRQHAEERSAWEEQAKHSKDELEKTNGELFKANELSRLQKQELDEMHESEDAELHDLRWQLKQAKEGEAAMRLKLEDVQSRAEADMAAAVAAAASAAVSRSTQQSPVRMDPELGRLRRELFESQIDRKGVEEELQNVKEELDMLRSLRQTDEVDQERAVETDDHVERDQLKARLDEMKGALDFANGQVDGLKHALAASEDRVATTITALEQTRRENEDLSRSLDQSRKDLETSQTEVAGTKVELSATQTELGELRRLNETFDVKVADALKRREARWRAKEQKWEAMLASLRTERETMSKALLRGWGKEQYGSAGDGGEQRYKYCFAPGKTAA